MTNPKKEQDDEVLQKNGFRENIFAI